MARSRLQSLSRIDKAQGEYIISSIENRHAELEMFYRTVLSAITANLLLFSGLAVWVRSWRKQPFILFDAQDLAKYPDGRSNDLPLSAQQGTFQPLLQHYINATQIMIAISAASISFAGGASSSVLVHVAKLTLASSIMWGVLFCWLMLYRYDEYSQNVKSYTLKWFAVTESALFACLICFVAGYGFWALAAL
jgi:hypothetical protein